ncbi:MAG: S8 family serine peptidase [Acidobacteria bacterium]|nr:S8 family serine peptidase [Acidobacteriota bacterium]
MRRTLTVLLLILLCFSSFGLSNSVQPSKLSPRLWQVYQSATPDDEYLVWVYFTDKGRNLSAKYAAARQVLTLKSRQRRLTMRRPENLVDFADLPLEDSYVMAVQQHVQQFRHASKWLNAVSARATKRQIDLIRRFEFVKVIDLVGRFKSIAPEPVEQPDLSLPPASGVDQAQSQSALDYGPSFTQLNQINVPAVHNLGDFGQGVVIAVLDAGFNNLGHEAFQRMHIIAARDFVNGDDDVGDGQDMGNGSHGTATLSVIGGFAPGKLIGPAFSADYILAKTENTDSERPVEEDNWVAGLEWAEGSGVDVMSSSVGYLDFDPGFGGYSWADMNGQTAVTTRAAVMAAQRGIVVVNAAGNSGGNPIHNTLIAPADGDGVIAAGAVHFDGERAGFSSVGPTVDGRIKPDVMALGVGVQTASPRTRSGYQPLPGTSFACPLVAGTAALILSAHPDWSPTQVLNALRSTASNAATPNNLTGWGIVNALAAVQFSSKRQGASSK